MFESRHRLSAVSLARLACPCVLGREGKGFACACGTVQANLYVAPDPEFRELTRTASTG
jgi:hypothetical protein